MSARSFRDNLIGILPIAALVVLVARWEQQPH